MLKLLASPFINAGLQIAGDLLEWLTETALLIIEAESADISVQIAREENDPRLATIEGNAQVHHELVVKQLAWLEKQDYVALVLGAFISNLPEWVKDYDND